MTDREMMTRYPTLTATQRRELSALVFWATEARTRARRYGPRDTRTAAAWRNAHDLAPMLDAAGIPWSVQSDAAAAPEERRPC